MNQDETHKWSCTTCSYANWPLARKCTLCLTPKESVIDVEKGKVKAEIIQPPSNKWTCKNCTYDNWPVTKRCTMCQVSKDDTIITAPNESEQTSDGACGASTKTTASGIVRNSRRSRKNRSTCNEPADKWVCSKCTYVNFPKTKKCVMCQTSPTPTYIRQLSNSSSSSTDSIHSTESRRSGTSRIIEKCTRTEQRSTLRPDRPEGRRTEKRKLLYDSTRKKQIRNKILQEDWIWIHACIGAIDGDPIPVETYIKRIGSITRALTPEEARVLSCDTHTVDPGQSLIHLALQRHSNHNVLVVLLSHQQQSRPSGTGGNLKRMPSYECPSTATEIRRVVASNLRQYNHGDFYCHYMSDPVTFILPYEIFSFGSYTQKCLFDEILDLEVQRVLEENRVVNWSKEIVTKHNSKLYALWNRSAGDCLLDSALQATWGVNDRDGSLRRALSNTLVHAQDKLYPRWKEYECMHAANLHYTLNESQWSTTWKKLVKLAEQPGKSLEQAHIFCLAHVLRRPVIVYGVKYVHNSTGEVLDYARFEGIYLPLLWGSGCCIKSPVVLGYTRGHFSALVGIQQESGDSSILLPLTDSQHQPLPLHFITEEEVGLQNELIREWFETTETSSGVLCAVQRVSSLHILTQRLINGWLLKYKRTNTT